MCEVVARKVAALLAAAALPLVAAAPAEAAAIQVEGSVTASSGTLRAACHYARLFQIYDYSDTSQITGTAVAATGATVTVRCVVTPRFGSQTLTAKGVGAAYGSKSVQLHGGPTQICVYATASHIIPMADEVASGCATYQD